MNGPLITLITLLVMAPPAIWFSLWLAKKDALEDMARHFWGWIVLPTGETRKIDVTEHWEAERDGKLRECGGGHDYELRKKIGGPVAENADEAFRLVESHPIWKHSSFIFRDERQAKLLALSRTMEAEKNLMGEAHDAHDRKMKLTEELEKEDAGSEEPAS